MVKILRKSYETHEAHFPKFSVFIGQKSLFRHHCIQYVKDGIQLQIYNINNENVNQFSQFISVKAKKILRKSQAQFRKKLRKLRLRQNDGFLTKNLFPFEGTGFYGNKIIDVHKIISDSPILYLFSKP